jgi:RsiW-degrading membrane proteinase PrsW (M82 family)
VNNLRKNETTIRLHKPSTNELLFFLLSGAIMSVPLTLFIDQYASVLLIGLPLDYAILISVAVFAPFIEEFSKAFPLFYRHGETQKSVFSLALFVGLGFGIVEFLTYVFALGVSPITRLPGLIFHPASTSITAYGIATKKPLLFYLVAVSLHLLNNVFVVLAPVELPTSIFVVSACVFISWRLYGKSEEKFIEQDSAV